MTWSHSDIPLCVCVRCVVGGVLQLLAKQAGFSTDIIQKITTVRAYSGEERELSVFYRFVCMVYNLGVKIMVVGQVRAPSLDPVSQCVGAELSAGDWDDRLADRCPVQHPAAVLWRHVCHLPRPHHRRTHRLQLCDPITLSPTLLD